MEEHELIAIVEEALNVKPGTVSLDTDLKSVDWDSLANVVFISEIDDKLRLTLDAQRLSECATPRDLLALVNAEVATSK